MSDEPFRFPISPIVMERNARRLVDIMAQFFPDGATSKDLQIRFEQVTGLQRQTFYDTIGFVKYKRWFVGGGKNKIYRLNSDGSWKLTQTSDGQILERDQLTHLVTVQTQQIGELRGEVVRLRDWASGDANGANNVARPDGHEPSLRHGNETTASLVSMQGILARVSAPIVSARQARAAREFPHQGPMRPPAPPNDFPRGKRTALDQFLQNSER